MSKRFSVYLTGLCVLPLFLAACTMPLTPPPTVEVGEVTEAASDESATVETSEPTEATAGPTDEAAASRTPRPTSTRRPTATPTPTITSTPRPAATRQQPTVDPNATQAPTATSTTASTSQATVTKQPTATFTPVSGAKQPYTGHFSGIGTSLKAIYQQGQSYGNNPRGISKIGDCEAAFPVFLQGFDAGTYDLGSYQYLNSVVSYFSGSFKRVGYAADGGMSSSALLNPIWANPNVCNSGESPLACEYRLNTPSVALIMTRTLDQAALDNGQFHYELTQIVQYTINQGIIPVLSTTTYWGPNNPDAQQINDIIRQVAAENGIPLWDFWLTSETLPNRGVTQDYHIADPAYTRSTYFDAESLQMAVTHRNLEALEILHAILTGAMQ
jgi:hypothetical protein